MIPILYDKNEQYFINEGICRLPDILDGTVTEERNGIYECEFKYPISGEHYNDIQEGRVICCWHDDTKTVQPFDIYGRSAPMDGIVTFYAHHISYRLGKIVLKPFTAGTCLEAFSKFNTYSVTNNPFTFWTDKDVTADFVIDKPISVKEILGGTEGSILDVYGKGEYEWDKYTVKFHLNRGQDNGVSIRYGKNLTKLTQSTDNSETYNAVVPFWTGYEEDMVTLTEWYITCSNYQQGDEILCVPMDLSDKFDEAPTEAQLRSKAQSILDGSDSWVAKDTIDVDFLNLWESQEFEIYKSLQRVSLCDKVDVINPKMDLVKIKMEVIKAVYNFVEERYKTMTLGTPKTSFSEVVKASTEELLADLPNKSFMQAAIDYATKLIQGGLGGHVIFGTNADGEPEEILIMDTDDTSTAVDVWRFNLNGLGHSHNGYNGPFSDIALTMDGRINASMITTGILNAGIVSTGILMDALGYNWWNLDTGEFHSQTIDTKIGQKCRTFTSQPTPPYSVGDLWFNSASSSIMVCTTAKTASQSYDAADWVKRDKYTDDTTANAVASDLASNYYTKTTTETLIQQGDGQILLQAAEYTDVMTYNDGILKPSDVRVDSIYPLPASSRGLNYSDDENGWVHFEGTTSDISGSSQYHSTRLWNDILSGEGEYFIKAETKNWDYPSSDLNLYFVYHDANNTLHVEALQNGVPRTITVSSTSYSGAYIYLSSKKNMEFSASFRITLRKNYQSDIDSINANKVGTNEIISKINLSPEQILIAANKLNLHGAEISLTTTDGGKITFGTSSSNYAEFKTGYDSGIGTIATALGYCALLSGPSSIMLRPTAGSVLLESDNQSGNRTYYARVQCTDDAKILLQICFYEETGGIDIEGVAVQIQIASNGIYIDAGNGNSGMLDTAVINGYTVLVLN